MGANLITSLQEIRDFRAAQGKRYPLWLILLLVVMGTISGCQSYYALEDFGVRHYQAVSEKLGLTVTRLPSDTTFRRILHYRSISKCWHSSSSHGLIALSILNQGSGQQLMARVLEELSPSQERLTRISLTQFQFIAVNKGQCWRPNSLNRTTIVS